MEQSTSNFLSAKSLIAVTIILMYTIAAPIFDKLDFHYIHESGISMILGMIVSLIAIVINPLVSFYLILGKFR